MKRTVLKGSVISIILAILALLGYTELATAQPIPESPYDPFVEPKTNIDLMNEVLLFELNSRQGNPLMHDCFLYVCRQAGFTPRIVQEAAGDQTAIGLVAAGMGISLVVGCLNKLYENQVVYLPLVEPRFEFEFALYWKRDRSLSLVDHFIDAALNQIDTSCAP